MTEYAELHCHSYYSLLDGASSPEALVERAQEIGLHALAITDHDSLAGVVRFWTAARRANLHAVFGAEVTLEDGCHLTLLAETQQGYANLCRLISASRLDQLPQDPDTPWPGKIAPSLTWSRLAEESAGIIALTGCRRGPIVAPLLGGQPEQALTAAARLLETFDRQNLFVEVQRHHLPEDGWLIRQLRQIASRFGLVTVATNNVHYAERSHSRLRDALIAIDQNESLAAAQQAGRLPLNDNYYLAAPGEMAQRFRELPDALRTSIEIAGRCQASLDFSDQRLPTFAAPDGLTAFEYLHQLCQERRQRHYPRMTAKILSQLAHELAVIEKAGLAGYFLIVWDIVQHARDKGIRCQGRGSAANSIVAYLLGITNIDPLAHNLLFERFLSGDRFTMPDIDLDFAADRREEVIQYVYAKYGHSHAAMVCNTVTFQARSALRDLGKALDFPAPVIERLANSLDTHAPAKAAEQILRQIPAEDATTAHPLRTLAGLLAAIDGCPRHLSIHSGGMLITGAPLHEVVPLEPATMPGRVVVQWDKDSVEDAGLVKLDLLGLRMLGLLSTALEYIAAIEGQAPDLDAIPLDNPALYDMLHRADTLGAFQVESRAQQQMLPRFKPIKFEDIIIEVAIVRPGPIQGGAVHPFLKRRAGVEEVDYPHECLKPVLAETMGVLLFQEQALRVAVTAAGFTPGEADLLRRALSRSRPEAEMQAMQQRFMAGAERKGIDPETAKVIWGMLAGFAGYGFPKSHAAGFALIAYQSLYLKHYHPAAFYCALLNHQPMGFYSAEVIIGDARRHEVDLLPPDINMSSWDYALERTGTGIWALRTGLRAVKGLGETGCERIETARQQGLFTGLEDFHRRTRLPKEMVSNLIRAGAFDAFGERRGLLWRLGGIQYQPDALDLSIPGADAELPDLAPLERLAWEYELLGLSPGGQVMEHYRATLRKAGILSTWEVKQTEPGRRITCAGMVVVRQRPQTAKGILFISIEDEAGLLDLVVKTDVYQQHRDILRWAPLLLATGVVQRASGATSVLLYAARALG